MNEIISYKIRKRILYMALLSILFICLWYHYAPKQYVLADTPDSSTEDPTDPSDKTQQTPDNIAAMFGHNCDLIFEICKSSRVVIDTVQKFTLVGKIRHEARAVQVQRIAVGIAIGLAYIYILLYILREAMRGEMTIEFWGKCFIILMITCIAASQWATLLDGLNRLGDNIIIMAFTREDENGKPIMDENGNILLVDDTAQMMYKTANSPVKMLVDQGVLNIPETEFESTDNEWATDAKTYWGGDIASATDKTDFESITVDKIDKNDSAFKTSLQKRYKDIVTDSSYSQLNLSNVINLIIRVLKIGMKCAIDAQIFFIALQLALRGAVMPIAIVGVASDGMRGGAIRFVKRYFALYIQEAIIIIIMIAFSKILLIIIDPSRVKGNIVEIYYVLTCYGAITAAISQSGSIAQEVIGD